jgi:hypothetical protein
MLRPRSAALQVDPLLPGLVGEARLRVEAVAAVTAPRRRGAVRVVDAVAAALPLLRRPCCRRIAVLRQR